MRWRKKKRWNLIRFLIVKLNLWRIKIGNLKENLRGNLRGSLKEWKVGNLIYWRIKNPKDNTNNKNRGFLNPHLKNRWKKTPNQFCTVTTTKTSKTMFNKKYLQQSTRIRILITQTLTLLSKSMCINPTWVEATMRHTSITLQLNNLRRSLFLRWGRRKRKM